MINTALLWHSKRSLCSWWPLCSMRYQSQNGQGRDHERSVRSSFYALSYFPWTREGRKKRAGMRSASSSRLLLHSLFKATPSKSDPVLLGEVWRKSKNIIWSRPGQGHVCSPGKVAQPLASLRTGTHLLSWSVYSSRCLTALFSLRGALAGFWLQKWAQECARSPVLCPGGCWASLLCNIALPFSAAEPLVICQGLQGKCRGEWRNVRFLSKILPLQSSGLHFHRK